MAALELDLVVIGSGPAGEKGAVQAAYFGKRVALVERAATPGGAKIHACALPSKMLRETALALSGLRRRDAASVDVGLRPGASMHDLLCHREPLVSREIARVRANLERHAVATFQGEAAFVDPHTIRVTPAAGPPLDLRGDVILIATGSTPHRPEGIPFDDPCVLDSDDLLAVDRLPETLAIIGGGVIGCELASMLAPLGVSITLLDRGARLLPFAGAEAAAILARSLARAGVTVRHGADVARVFRAGDHVVCELAGGDRVDSGHVLVCAGRDGQTARLGLAAAGLAATERGRLEVDDRYRTAVPHIYAAGDVIGFPQLASTSMEQARVAMCHAFDLGYKTRVSPVVPLGVYTIPELSMVGDTEDSARAKGIDAVTGRAHYRDNPRGQLVGDTEGLLEIVFERSSRRLLGASIVGDSATELIHVATTALQLGATIDLFIDAVYNFPTLTDLYKYAAYDGLGKLAAPGCS